MGPPYCAVWFFFVNSLVINYETEASLNCSKYSYGFKAHFPSASSKANFRGGLEYPIFPAELDLFSKTVLGNCGGHSCCGDRILGYAAVCT
jgi:hypothetical protein